MTATASTTTTDFAVTPPFVSVIIPVYNDQERLQLCLDALARQTYPQDRFEVIVVDNGSQHDPEPLIACYERVTLAREARRGSYAARNSGLQQARGEIIAFTDSDCIPADNWIERGVSRLEHEANCGLVAGRIDVFFRDPAHPTGVELYELLRAFPQRHWVEDENYGATANVFTRRSVLDKVGPFDAQLKSSGDREWGRRVHAAGYRLVYADEAAIAHPARYGLDEMKIKSARVIGGFQDYYGVRKRIKGLVRELLPPLSEIITIMREPRLATLSQRLAVLGVLLRLRLMRARLRIKMMWSTKRETR